MERQNIIKKSQSKWVERIIILIVGFYCLFKGLIEGSWLLSILGALSLYAFIEILKNDRWLRRHREMVERKRIDFLETLTAPDFMGPRGTGKSFIYTINCRQSDAHRFGDVLSQDLISKSIFDGRLIITKPISFEDRKKILGLVSCNIPFYGNLEKHEYESGKIVTSYYYCFAAYNGKYMEHQQLPFRNCKPAVQVGSTGEVEVRELERAQKFLLLYQNAVGEI